MMILRNKVHSLLSLLKIKIISSNFATSLNFLKIFNFLSFLSYSKMCINVSETLKKKIKTSKKILIILLTSSISLTVKFFYKTFKSNVQHNCNKSSSEIIIYSIKLDVCLIIDSFQFT